MVKTMKSGDLVQHDLWGLAVVIRKVSPHVDRWWIRIFDEMRIEKKLTCWGSELEASMKVGDLVKPKHQWKHVKYNPQKVKNQVGIILALSREYGWYVYWIEDGSKTFKFGQDLEVIDESR